MGLSAVTVVLSACLCLESGVGRIKKRCVDNKRIMTTASSGNLALEPWRGSGHVLFEVKPRDHICKF